jgi:hypothetical protein
MYVFIGYLSPIKILGITGLSPKTDSLEFYLLLLLFFFFLFILYNFNSAKLLEGYCFLHMRADELFQNTRLPVIIRKIIPQIVNLDDVENILKILKVCKFIMCVILNSFINRNTKWQTWKRCWINGKPKKFVKCKFCLYIFSDCVLIAFWSKFLFNIF